MLFELVVSRINGGGKDGAWAAPGGELVLQVVVADDSEIKDGGGGAESALLTPGGEAG